MRWGVVAPVIAIEELSLDGSGSGRRLGESRCELLSGFFAYFIQGLLAFVALASLVYKRHIERPRRPWLVWGLDVGKQLVGGFFIHFANILVSELLQEADGKSGDECAFYFINYFIDCTLGVLVVYTAHEAICLYARVHYGDDCALAHVGEYGEPPNYRVWAAQLGAYLGALLFNKALVASCLYALINPMTSFSNWLFSPLQPYPHTELVVVMVLCPWFLQTVQFWLFDVFLKAKPKSAQDEPYASTSMSAPPGVSRQDEPWSGDAGKAPFDVGGREGNGGDDDPNARLMQHQQADHVHGEGDSEFLSNDVQAP